MNVFHCDYCQQLVFFENVSCITCGHTLAYLPDIDDMASLEPADGDKWKSRAGKIYRLCENDGKENVCNWAVPAEATVTLFESCRLTSTIPDLRVSGNREKWYRLEVAKRRLLYSLRRLKLPCENSAVRATELRFEFLADAPEPDGPKVLTGHNEGRITINVAEADDAEREKRRLALHEPYRTLLGHFRHEIGHYYWDRQIPSMWTSSQPRKNFDNVAERTNCLRRTAFLALGPLTTGRTSVDFRHHRFFASSYGYAPQVTDWSDR